MTADVLTLASVPTLHEIEEIFKSTHAAWPVHNIAGNLCGVMPRNVLHKLVSEKAFYKQRPKLSFWHSPLVKEEEIKVEPLLDMEAQGKNSIVTSQ
mgnify:FL=1|jgi:hypothetical protein